VQARWDRIFGAGGGTALGVHEEVEKQLSLAEELEPLIQDFPYALSADRREVVGSFSGRPLRYRCDDRNTTFHLDAVVTRALFFAPF